MPVFVHVGVAAGSFDQEWIVSRFRAEFDRKFQAIGPVNGKISGSQAKEEMKQSKLPNNVLGKIWIISDIDKDGMRATHRTQLHAMSTANVNPFLQYTIIIMRKSLSYVS